MKLNVQGFQRVRVGGGVLLHMHVCSCMCVMCSKMLVQATLRCFDLYLQEIACSSYALIMYTVNGWLNNTDEACGNEHIQDRCSYPENGSIVG